jgi:murein L,D-transpeptidase YcbB/YkuD
MSAHPIVVPKFISELDSESVLPGYQEAHRMYDEMRQFFAKKAMSVHSGEVVVIKVTMMSLKPGYKSPSVVSVRDSLNTYTGS